MDLKNILSELHRIEKLVEGWSQKKTIATIERDLALDKLKSLYEAVRFAEAVSDLPDSEDKASDLQTAQPLVNPTLEQPLSPALEEPMVIDFDDMMPLEEEAVGIADKDEEPFEELPTEEQPQQEPQSEELPKEEQPKVELTTEERVENEAETEEPTAAPAIQNSLFDLNEIPVHRRSSRRVFLSLYGEQNEAHTTKRKPKSERPDSHPEEPAERESQHPLAEAIREELTESEEFSPQHPQQESPAHQSGEAQSTENSESWNDDSIFRETEVKTVPVSPSTPSESTPVLGEVIHADQHTLADTFIPRPTVASSLAMPHGSLKDSLALNDRYLLRKELFGDDEKAFHAALEMFDQMPSLDDCMIYIAENYTWNANSDAAKMLTELLEHKFGE